MDGTDGQRRQWIAAEAERLREIGRRRHRRFWRRGTFWFAALLGVAYGLWQLFWLAVGLLLRYLFPYGIG